MATQIYIVEDHTLMRRLTCEAIEKMPGFSVCGTAGSAEEALDAIDGAEVDLVLIDVSLPQMSGLELLEVLLDRWPTLRCLIFSGHKEPTYVRQALSAGARGYLLKGNPYEIRMAIDEVLAGNRFLSEALQMSKPNERAS